MTSILHLLILPIRDGYFQRRRRRRSRRRHGATAAGPRAQREHFDGGGGKAPVATALVHSVPPLVTVTQHTIPTIHGMVSTNSGSLHYASPDVTALVTCRHASRSLATERNAPQLFDDANALPGAQRQPPATQHGRRRRRRGHGIGGRVFRCGVRFCVETDRPAACAKRHGRTVVKRELGEIAAGRTRRRRRRRQHGATARHTHTQRRSVTATCDKHNTHAHNSEKNANESPANAKHNAAAAAAPGGGGGGGGGTAVATCARAAPRAGSSRRWRPPTDRRHTHAPRALR